MMQTKRKNKNQKIPATTTSKWILLLLAFTQNSFARADVNMKDGSFITTRIDLRISGSGPAFLLSRTYNSRSTKRGAFGFGWESNLEARLKPRANGVETLKIAGRAYHIEYDSRARVTEIRSGKRIRLRYSYRDETLHQVQEQNAVVTTYQYDSVQNLTLIKEGKSHEQIEYDQDHDRVLTHRTASGCEEAYEYVLSGTLQPETRLERHCPKQQPKRLRSRFTYGVRQDGQIVLVKTQLTSDKKLKEIFYDPQTGAAVRIANVSQQETL